MIPPKGWKQLIRIVIADDHPIVRDALRALLSRESDFEVIGEASDGREALDCIRGLDPDVLMLDLKMPTLDGLATLQVLQQWNNRTKVVVLTESEDKNEFIQAMKLGCLGIVRKQAAPDLIIKSIRKVYEGEIWLDSLTTSEVMYQFASGDDTSAPVGKARQPTPLSPRERQIVQWAAQGLKNKDIAETMFITEQTVKNHLHSAFKKLGVSDRLELALYAVYNGLHLNQKK